MRRMLTCCAVPLVVVAMMFAGCGDSGGGLTGLDPSLMTTQEKDVVDDAKATLAVMDQVMDLVLGVGMSNATGGTKTPVPVDEVIDLSVYPNLTGTVNITGVLDATGTDTSGSVNGSLNVTFGSSGEIQYDDGVDSLLITLPAPGMTATVSASFQGSGTGESGSITLTFSYSNLSITGTVGGNSITATMSESWTLTASGSGSDTAISITVNLTGYKELDFVVNGESHTVRIDLEIHVTATGDPVTPDVTADAKVFVQVDGTRYEYTAAAFMTEYGIDYSYDISGLLGP